MACFTHCGSPHPNCEHHRTGNPKRFAKVKKLLPWFIDKLFQIMMVFALVLPHVKVSLCVSELNQCSGGSSVYSDAGSTQTTRKPVLEPNTYKLESLHILRVNFDLQIYSSGVKEHAAHWSTHEVENRDNQLTAPLASRVRLFSTGSSLELKR